MASIGMLYDIIYTELYYPLIGIIFQVGLGDAIFEAGDTFSTAQQFWYLC